MISKKKIYISGCGGMLGEAFYRIFSSDYEIRCTDKIINEEWISLLDFRNFESYRNDVFNFSPDYLFHLGAHTDLEFCEVNPDDAYLTNTISVENAAHIANQLNIPLFYVSTAGIFDGKKELYDDWDVPNPLGHYARSKYAGELYVVQNVRKHLVCRAGWMMGGGPSKDKKFIQKIMYQIKMGKKELFIVDDKLGTPTYTDDFASNVKLLIENNLWGVYNMVCGGVTSRLEVTQKLLELLKLDHLIHINTVSSDFFSKEYFADRPASERLISSKLQLRGLNIMRDWRLCLEEYLNKYYATYL